MSRVDELVHRQQLSRQVRWLTRGPDTGRTTSTLGFRLPATPLSSRRRRLEGAIPDPVQAVGFDGSMIFSRRRWSDSL
jgi:hypothetical protein